MWFFFGVFKAFEASDVCKEQLCMKKFVLPYINHFPGQFLSCKRSSGSSILDALGASSLVQDRNRDLKCMVSLFCSGLI